MVTKKAVAKILDNINDPEIGISITSLGLVYDIKVSKSGNIKVIMTLTSVGCPLFEQISTPIQKQLKTLPGVKNVEVELTFDPPWSVDKMSPAAKMHLGME